MTTPTHSPTNNHHALNLTLFIQKSWKIFQDLLKEKTAFYLLRSKKNVSIKGNWGTQTPKTKHVIPNTHSSKHTNYYPNAMTTTHLPTNNHHALNLTMFIQNHRTKPTFYLHYPSPKEIYPRHIDQIHQKFWLSLS